MADKKILCAGYLCLDLLAVCESFPQEDTDQLCLDHRWQVGGNSVNNSVVLAHLGESPDLFANLASDFSLSFFQNKLSQAGVDISNCPVLSDQQIPISMIVVNSSNGSRTIMHHRGKNFPQLSCEAFKKLNLSKYSWIIFEGRFISSIPDMIAYLRQAEPSVKVSVELEKPRTNIECLLTLADVIFVSKDYARFRGFGCKEDAVKGLKNEISVGAILVCAWGEDGAAALVDGELVSVPAVPPSRVVDTLGAGDTFVSSTILALSKGHSIKKSIEFGCQVAGFKCGIPGFDGIKTARTDLISTLL